MLFNLEVWYRRFFDGQETEALEEWIDSARGEKASSARTSPTAAAVSGSGDASGLAHVAASEPTA